MSHFAPPVAIKVVGLSDPPLIFGRFSVGRDISNGLPPFALPESTRGNRFPPIL
jgi:hypothetical protein